MLASLEDIADKSLLLSKLDPHFQDPEAAKLCILNKISFCEAPQKVSFPFFPHFSFCKYPNILLIGALSMCIIIAWLWPETLDKLKYRMMAFKQDCKFEGNKINITISI